LNHSGDHPKQANHKIPPGNRGGILFNPGY
jgi:hypothetical protein